MLLQFIREVNTPFRGWGAKKSRLSAGCTNQIPLTIKPYPMKTLNYIYNCKIQNLVFFFYAEYPPVIHQTPDIYAYYK